MIEYIRKIKAIIDTEKSPKKGPVNNDNGNKIINIPSSRLQSREEYVVDYAVVAEGEALVVHSGKRYLVMKPKDLAHYCGERGRRGHKLPRGFQKVDRLDVDSGT